MALAADWPSTALLILGDAARVYYYEAGEPFAVPDVLLDRAIENVTLDLAIADSAGGFDDADESWYARWEDGTLDVEMRAAIQNWSETARKVAL